MNMNEIMMETLEELFSSKYQLENDAPEYFINLIKSAVKLKTGAENNSNDLVAFVLGMHDFIRCLNGVLPHMYKYKHSVEGLESAFEIIGTTRIENTSLSIHHYRMGITMSSMMMEYSFNLDNEDLGAIL